MSKALAFTVLQFHRSDGKCKKEVLVSVACWPMLMMLVMNGIGDLGGL